MPRLTTSPARFPVAAPRRTFSRAIPPAAREPSLPGVRARVDISAPGEQLSLAYTTTDPTGYSQVQGTSFSGPTVVGGLALLSDYVRSNPGLFATPGDIASALDGRVTKAVLQNSADKTAGWSNAQTLQGGVWRTTQALDYDIGAGALNLDQAFRQYAAAGVTQLTAAAATNAVGPTGWARGTLTRVGTAEASNLFALGNLAAYSELNSTLSYYANRQYDLTSFAFSDVAFHNLKLEVLRADAGGNYTIPVGESNAAYIASEHLSFLAPVAGDYAVRVSRPAGAAGTVYSFAGDDDQTTYGLAWLNRDSVVAAAGTLANPAVAGAPNLVIAPEAGQTAGATFSAGVVNFTNSAYVGGTDRGPGGVGTLTVSGSGTVVGVSNKVVVSPDSAIVLNSGGRLETGRVDLAANATATATGTGTSSFQFTALNMADNSGLIAAAGSTLATVPVYENFSRTLVSRINLAGVARFGGDGNVTLTAPSFGPGTFAKVGPGTVTLSGGGKLPTGGSVDLRAGTLDLGTTTSTINSLDVAAGSTLRVPSGNASLTAGQIRTAGGAINLSGTDNFSIRINGAGITSSASPTTSIWTGGTAQTRIQNNSAAALPVTVAAGSTPAGIDLDIGITLSSAGTNVGFVKQGAGTLRIGSTGNTADLTVQSGSLRVDDLAALGSGNLTLAGGRLSYGGSPSGATAKAFTLAAGSGVEVLNANPVLTLSGQLDFGGNTLTKTGPGTLALTGASVGTSAARTVVSQGVLQLNGSLPNGSAVTVQNGGTVNFQANGPGALTVQTGGLVIAANNVSTGSAVTLAGTVSPGASPGQVATLQFGGGTSTFAAGSHYTWDIATTAGGAGSGWDFLTSPGVLSVSGLTIDAFSPTAGIANFDKSQSYAFAIATFTGGLSGGNFAVNTAGLGNYSASDGAFTALIQGNNLNLQFTPSPVPEPAGILAAGTALLAGACAWRRRRG